MMQKKVYRQLTIGGVKSLRWRKISDAVVRRLPLYLRVLDELAKNDEHNLISSQELGEKAGVGPALVRKDLAWFGEFGKQGVGYEVAYLRTELRRILNLDSNHKVVLVGVGSLGTALARYNMRRFQYDKSFTLELVGLFDSDPAKVGQEHEGVSVYPVSDLEGFVRDNNVKMGIITVPASEAQAVATKMVNGGVQAILNFAPLNLDLPEHVQLASADLTLELKRLAYYLEEE